MKSLFSFLISTVLAGSLYAKGGTVGNGGYVITCATAPNFLSLDYVLAKSRFAADTKIASITTLKESLTRIAALIDKKIPQLSHSFSQFVQHIGNESDYSKPYLWDEKRFGLSYETDDQQIDNIPFWCEGIRRSGGWIQQVVIRTVTEKENGQQQIRFEFDKNILSHLTGLQASFVYLHEWLWNISDDVEKNRKINYFMHSTQMESMSSEQVINEMRKYGVDLK